jgi:hypothetical protein
MDQTQPQPLEPPSRTLSNDVLEARTIKLYDDQGNMYAMLGKTQSGHGLTLYTDDGSLYASLGQTTLGYGIILYDANGDRRTEIDVTRTSTPTGAAIPGVPRITLLDQQRRARVNLSIGQWPRMWIGDPDGPFVELNQDGDSASLMMIDTNEDVRLQADIHNGAGRFSILNSDASWLWTAPPRAQEQPRTDSP